MKFKKILKYIDEEKVKIVVAIFILLIALYFVVKNSNIDSNTAGFILSELIRFGN